MLLEGGNQQKVVRCCHPVAQHCQQRRLHSPIIIIRIRTWQRIVAAKQVHGALGEGPVKQQGWASATSSAPQGSALSSACIVTWMLDSKCADDAIPAGATDTLVKRDYPIAGVCGSKC